MLACLEVPLKNFGPSLFTHVLFALEFTLLVIFYVI